MNAEDRSKAAARALPLVDLTNLNADCSHDDIDALCKRAQTPFGNVGAICIWPRFVGHAHKVLAGIGIPIATVVNFPGGTASVEMTVLETRTAIEDGADEIDLVMPYRDFANGDVENAKNMIATIRAETNGKALLKVIIETGELGDNKLVAAASDLAIAEGTDFIKTSTGKVPVNATPEVAEIMI